MLENVMLCQLPYSPGMTILYLTEYKTSCALYYLESKKIDVHSSVPDTTMVNSLTTG